MGQTCQSTVIAAPAEAVWTAVRDFHDMSWAPGVITNLEKIGDAAGDQVGAGRLLNGVFRETLLSLDDAGRTLTYSIDEGPSPVSSDEVREYVGRVRVGPDPEGGGTLVEWSSSWEGNDEAAQAFCRPIYLALLAELKASLQGDG